MLALDLSSHSYLNSPTDLTGYTLIYALVNTGVSQPAQQAKRRMMQTYANSSS